MAVNRDDISPQDYIEATFVARFTLLIFYALFDLRYKLHYNMKQSLRVIGDIRAMRPNLQPLKLAIRGVSAHASFSTSISDTRTRVPSPSKVNWGWFRVKDDMAQERSDYNMLHDACRAGRAAKASRQSSSATSERPEAVGGENPNKKAERDYPGAPKPVMGMNDERGHVSFVLVLRANFGKEVSLTRYRDYETCQIYERNISLISLWGKSVYNHFKCLRCIIG